MKGCLCPTCAPQSFAPRFTGIGCFFFLKNVLPAAPQCCVHTPERHAQVSLRTARRMYRPCDTQTHSPTCKTWLPRESATYGSHSLHLLAFRVHPTSHTDGPAGRVSLMSSHLAALAAGAAPAHPPQTGRTRYIGAASPRAPGRISSHPHETRDVWAEEDFEVPEDSTAERGSAIAGPSQW